MHQEMKPVPENMHASLIREKISQKVASAVKVAASQEDVDYVDLIYLINNKKIQQNVIRAFLKEMYHQQLEDLNTSWKQKLSESRILKDVYAIKRKAVEKQWTQVNINQKHIRQKEEKYKKYESSFKNRKQLNQRIKKLSDNIKIIENNINMCKNQHQELKLRQQYQQMKEELRFLTNKSRKLKHLSEEKMINSSLSRSQEKLMDIYQRIQEISIEEKRLKQIQHLKFNKKSSTKSTDNSPKKSKHRLKKLQQIFIEFSRKEVKQFMLFDEIMKTHKYMSLENFLRFVSCSGIGSQLNLDEKVSIFKNVSQFNSKISFLEFTEILKQICMKQCEKLEVKFEASILDTFLEQMMLKLQENSSRKPYEEPLLSNSNDFIKKLRSQVFSNYQFKIKSHTGKQKNDIKQYLVEKKKSNKTEPSMNLSSKKSNIILAKITDSSQSISRNGDRTQSYKTDNKFIKRKLTTNYKTVSVNNNQSNSETTVFKSSFDKDSYSNIFLRKRNILRSQKRQEKVSNDDLSQKIELEEQNTNLKQPKRQIFITLTPATYDRTAQKGQIQLNQLNDIVQLDQDDPFLANHLSLNYSIKANKHSSQQFNYHF